MYLLSSLKKTTKKLTYIRKLKCLKRTFCGYNIIVYDPDGLLWYLFNEDNEQVKHDVTRWGATRS